MKMILIMIMILRTTMVMNIVHIMLTVIRLTVTIIRVMIMVLTIF